MEILRSSSLAPRFVTFGLKKADIASTSTSSRMVLLLFLMIISSSVVLPTQAAVSSVRTRTDNNSVYHNNNVYHSSNVYHNNNVYHDHHDEEFSNSDFDMFLFTMTYLPEFCYTHDTATYPGCSSKNNVNPNNNTTLTRPRVTIHGLWPERSMGGYPQFCRTGNDATLDLKVIQELTPQFEHLWPDEKNPHSTTNPMELTDFYQHEWAKHGTCTNLTQLEYFSAAFTSYVKPNPPTLIDDYYGKDISTDLLRSAFEQQQEQETPKVLLRGQQTPQSSSTSSVVLICSGHTTKQYLEEIRICMTNEKGAPGKAFPCPKAVIDSMSTDMCQSDQIRLTTFRTSEFSTATH